MLLEIGIRTPPLLNHGKGNQIFPFDWVLVEFIEIDCNQGVKDSIAKMGTFEFLSYVGNILGKLHSKTRSYSGEISFTNSNAIPWEIYYGFTKLHLNKIDDSIINSYTKDSIISYIDRLSSKFLSRNTYHLSNCDFKPDNLRFTAELDIVLIDFENIQYTDLEFELAQYQIPTFSLTNCRAFIDSYFSHSNYKIDQFRMSFYKICLAINQIYNCSVFNLQEKTELNDQIIKSNCEYLKSFLIDK